MAVLNRSNWRRSSAGWIAIRQELRHDGHDPVSLRCSSAAPPLLQRSLMGRAGCIALLVIWCVRITPLWIRTAAFSYAERLLGICETFPSGKTETKIIR
jgi:hypothetical protein